MHAREINFFDPALASDPFPAFEALQRDAPALWSDALYGWVITRHEDCSALLRDRRMSSARMPRLFAMLYGQTPIDPASVTYEHHTKTMLFADPPEHGRLRATMARAFTPRALEAYREPIARTVARALDEFAAGGGGDVVTGYARPISGAVIAEIMGVPAADRAQVSAWTAAAIGFLRGAAGGPELLAAVEDALRRFLDYAQGLIEDRRKSPREDLISFLVEAHEQERLSDWELSNQTVQLIAAGQFTIEETIGMSVLTLLEHPDQLDRLKADPALWETAVDECARFTTPAQVIHRIAAEPVELHGQTLRAGDLVYLFLSAANSDARIFPEPRRLDVGRAEASRHLGFAAGPHFCLGASLARLELRAALRSFFERLPAVRLAGPPVPLPAGVFARALLSLPVAW